MNFNPRLTPWRIDDAEFYELEHREEQLAFLLRYATLAPSVRNTQPWSFRITPEGIEVYADYTRRLHAIDPADRELLISIGASIANLRVAAAHFGFETAVDYRTETDEALPVAAIAVRETSSPDVHVSHLFPAIKRRRTNRRTFDGEPLEPHALSTMFDLMSAFPDTLNLVLPYDHLRAAELVESAERMQLAHAGARAEIRHWLRRDDETTADGIPFDALGMSRTAAWFFRHFGTVRGKAHHDRELIESASALIVVSSQDDRASIIRAGEALEQLLLTITNLRLEYSILTAPIEIEHMRDRVWMLAASPNPPQVLVRVGRANRVRRPAPRRRLEAVLR